MAFIEIELLGWFGVALLVWAYFLLTDRKITAKSLEYQGLNLVGSILVGLNSFFNQAYPSVLANFVWLLIAIWGLERIVRAHRIGKDPNKKKTFKSRKRK